MNALFASKWLSETVATLTPGPKITIPHNQLLFNKIKYPQPTIKDLLPKAEIYESERLNSKIVPGFLNTRAGLARNLGISKARLTQIMKFKNQVTGCDISDWYNKSIKIEKIRYTKSKKCSKSVCS
jgi:hypothetical protein